MRTAESKPRTFEDALDTILAEMRAVMVSKQADYGPGNIAAFGELGVLVRASDKLERLKHLITGNRTPNHESIDDAWLDLANYGIIAQMVRRSWWGLPMESGMDAE